jgi:hypothetical protein
VSQVSSCCRFEGNICYLFQASLLATLVCRCIPLTSASTSTRRLLCVSGVGAV